MSNLVTKNLKYWLLHRRPKDFARWFGSCNSLLWRSGLKIRYDADHGVLVADDGVSDIRFCRVSRYERYTGGIEARLDRLAREYMIDGITFRDGDCVLDCGANVGEVSLWFRRRYPKVRIIAVEPEELEANCVDINVFGGQPQTVRKVLWKEDGALPFFTKPESADSSLFQIADHGAVTTVPATTVASLLAEQNVPRLRLLKLEAEGAEPEIIQGCGDFLDRIDYIAADCGPERGLAQDETATDLINYLLPRNFELLDMRFDRVTCLFRNRNAVP